MKPGQLRPSSPWAEATRSISAPLVVVDLDAFDTNAMEILARAGSTPVRVASKSVRVRHLIHRALDHGFTGVMAYSLHEALWLAEDGIDDVLVAYPCVDTAALMALATRADLREKITIMVDDVSQIALAERAFIKAGWSEGAPVNVCLDIDASLRIGFTNAFIHLGVRRSPIRTPSQAVTLARAVERTGRLRVRGVMFYEAQVAGVPDAGIQAPAIRIVKNLSMRELATRRPAVVGALEEALGRPMLVNGGGSGSVQRTAADPTVTEVTSGSGLYCPTLFDSYDTFTPRPSAFFALDVVRHPAPGIITAFGGGYVASGPGVPSRLPSPIDGARFVGSEGAGEVQTPLRYRRGQGRAPIGGRVWFRHAKAGEAMERFNQVHLVRGPALMETVPTYRGEGRNFG